MKYHPKGAWCGKGASGRKARRKVKKILARRVRKTALWCNG